MTRAETGLGWKGGCLDAPNDNGRVDAEHAEGHVQDGVDATGLERIVENQVLDRALGIEVFDVDRGVNDSVREGRQVAGQFQGRGRAHGVADVALRVVDVDAVRVAEHLADGAAFDHVSRRCRGRVGRDQVDLRRFDSGVLEGQPDAAVLPGRIRVDEIRAVGVDAVAEDLAIDARTAPLGILETLEGVEATTLGDHDPVAVAIERPRGARGVRVFGQRPLGGEAGEDSEGVDALGDAPGQGQVDLSQLQHLGAVHEPQVAGRAGAPEAVGRAVERQVERDLAGRVVGHGAGVVVVGPVAQVEVVLADVVDFGFGLDVAVLGRAGVDTDARRVELRALERRVPQGFVRTPDRDAAGARAASGLLALLVAQRIEVADAGQGFAEVADLIGPDARAAGQEVRAHLGEVVAVRARETDAGDDDPRKINHGDPHGRRRSVRPRARRSRRVPPNPGGRCAGAVRVL